MNALLASGILAFFTVLIVLAANRAIWRGLKQGRSPVYCVTLSTLTLLSIFALILIISRLAFQQNLVSLWQQEFEISLQATKAMYLELGLDEMEIQRAVRLVRLLFLEGAVGWVVVLSTALSLVSYLIQRRIFSQFAGTLLPMPVFTRWRISERVIWLLLGALVLVLIGSRGLPWVGWLGLNSLIVLSSFYFIIGIAVMMFFFEKRKVSRPFKILAVVIMGFIPALLIFVTLVGVFDTWWDWRKLRLASCGND